MGNENELSFDEIKSRLDEIAEAVSADDMSLDEALDLYEEAVSLGMRASELIEESEEAEAEVPEGAEVDALDGGEADALEGDAEAPEEGETPGESAEAEAPGEASESGDASDREEA